MHRSKENALSLIRGIVEKLFLKLPLYFHILRANNLGTITYIEVDPLERFKYFLMTLKPSLQGFSICLRRIIIVDGAYLLGRYVVS